MMRHRSPLLFTIIIYTLDFLFYKQNKRKSDYDNNRTSGFGGLGNGN